MANARDDRPGDLPHLLRRLATAIEDHAITGDQLLDVTISSEATFEGTWWSSTVYWSLQAGSDTPARLLGGEAQPGDTQRSSGRAS